MKVVAIIPARYAASRLPGKPLAQDTGRFLIQHVYEQVAKAKRIDDVVVATDDQRIVDAVASFGGTAVLTRDDHRSGTDRVAEAAQNLACDWVINVQGDEPEIDPDHLDRLIGRMIRGNDARMGTLACPFDNVPQADVSDPSAVKVVLNRAGNALYFSRSPIPYHRHGAEAPMCLLHVGVYAYRSELLQTLASLPPTPHELSESLEQLRALEHGINITVEVVESACVGIDTADDYAAFVDRFEAKAEAGGVGNPHAG